MYEIVKGRYDKTMGIEELRKSHIDELLEAGISPEFIILPGKLDEAQAEYLHFVNKSEFFNKLIDNLKKKTVSKIAFETVEKAAYGESQKVSGALAILNALGIYTKV